MFMKFQLKEKTPGGSNQGIDKTRKNKVIGVVFHISLLKNFMSPKISISLVAGKIV